MMGGRAVVSAMMTKCRSGDSGGELEAELMSRKGRD